ncbi:site-specific integrase [Haloarcula laminariae]|uniref:site-specific integrase n=1 Tax=Haloarcula laminariae TaxID=2961577 RepID=UPI0032AF955C
MQLENYDNQDGYRVVLTTTERSDLAEEIENTHSSISWQLASYCGLRRQEIEHVRFRDVRKRETGDWILRVWEDGAKRGKYRETPIPHSVAVRINTVQETGEVNPDDTIIQQSMRTCTRHLKQAAAELQEENGDEGWQHVRLHDGRRTWANSLLDNDVSPLQVMEWGSWDDWITFREHYLQKFTAEKQSREISKVDWL